MTSLGFGPLARIDGPPPLRPRYGLLQTAEARAPGVRIVTDEDAGGVERWGNGVEVYSYPTDTGDTWDACAAGSDRGVKSSGSDPPAPQFAAFTAYLPIHCKSYRIGDIPEFRSRVLAAFAAVESFIVAREFATGRRMLINPHLADGNGTFPNADNATSVTFGFALLEREIAASGRAGIIHCSPSVAEYAPGLSGREDDGGVVRTPAGTVVVADAGYSAWHGGPNVLDPTYTPEGKTNPGGYTQEWIYATGPVDIRRSDVVVMPEDPSEALNRGIDVSDGGQQLFVFRAERDYLIDWDTVVQASVKVDLDRTGA